MLGISPWKTSPRPEAANRPPRAAGTVKDVPSGQANDCLHGARRKKPLADLREVLGAPQVGVEDNFIRIGQAIPLKDSSRARRSFGGICPLPNSKQLSSTPLAGAPRTSRQIAQGFFRRAPCTIIACPERDSVQRFGSARPVDFGRSGRGEVLPSDKCEGQRVSGFFVPESGGDPLRHEAIRFSYE